VPSNFPDLAYDISTNPPTEKGFELGKNFYDGRLASDGLVSCGFCHLQENAFTHHGHTVSHGVDNAWEPEMHLLFKIWLFNVLLCMMVPCPI
jgi:cytochrome c peroxidase